MWVNGVLFPYCLSKGLGRKGSMWGVTTTHITWSHFDSCVHFTPFVHLVKLPVQDKIPIICHHGTLESNFPRMKIQVDREAQKSGSNNQRHLS